MRHQILQYLRLNSDKYISGQTLSNKLGVSRTAIWKHINALREQGYQISSSTNLGYKLEGIPDVITENDILQELRTKILGRNIYCFEQVESTNTVAKEFARQGAPHGTAITAENQTKGRGRLGRQWSSPNGGIWLSIILRPALHPTECPGLTLLSGLAVARAITRYLDLPAMIKWPNDVLIEQKKVCGILTEMSAEMDKVHYVVIGIGINANVDLNDLPKDVQTSATSLKAQLHCNISRAELIRTILEELENILDSTGGILRNALESIRELSCTIGTIVKVDTGQARIEGMAIDITEEGALLVQTDDGDIKKVIAGDIAFR
jgi:BirA family biotin operon repressor/biotin-[acetyl-CoA-carboxylase] ligase